MSVGFGFCWPNTCDRTGGGKCILREYTFPFNGLYCPASYGMKLSLASKVFYYSDMFLPKMKTFECRALTLTVGHKTQ